MLTRFGTKTGNWTVTIQPITNDLVPGDFIQFNLPNDTTVNVNGIDTYCTLKAQGNQVQVASTKATLGTVSGLPLVQVLLGESVAATPSITLELICTNILNRPAAGGNTTEDLRIFTTKQVCFQQGTRNA